MSATLIHSCTVALSQVNLFKMFRFVCFDLKKQMKQANKYTCSFYRAELH